MKKIILKYFSNQNNKQAARKVYMILNGTRNGWKMQIWQWDFQLKFPPRKIISERLSVEMLKCIETVIVIQLSGSEILVMLAHLQGDWNSKTKLIVDR